MYNPSKISQNKILPVTLALLILSPFALTAKVVEPIYKVTLDEAHIGDLEIDTKLLDSYGRLPDNIRSFYLDARAVFEADLQADFTDPKIIAAAKKHDILIMGGPMLGDLKSDGVTIWLRTAKDAVVKVKVIDPKTQKSLLYNAGTFVAGEEQRIVIEGLKANTHYDYSILIDGESTRSGHFTTAPAYYFDGEFRIAFGADFHKVGVHNPNLMREIVARDAHVMLMYGDSAVDDREELVNMHRADYQLRDVAKSWRDFAANIPVYTGWDDHDYFNNDLNGIPPGFTAQDVINVRAVWQENWVNPLANDGRVGINHSTRIGPVEIIMLDTRSLRENERRNEYGSFLGMEQQQWLLETLRKSTADFIIISSGTMWSDYMSNAKDTWGSWDIEAREEIFSLIEDEGIAGVLLICGDRHGARAFTIPRESGHEFYEFEVGSLGGVPGPKAMAEDTSNQLFGYTGAEIIAFGEFTFDTSKGDPEVTFRLIGEAGNIMEKIHLTRSQLTP